MPYLKESDSQTVDVTYGRPTGVGGTTTYTFAETSLTKSQEGWRNAGEQEAAYRDLLAKQQDASWSSTLSLIDSFDRYERAMTNPVIRTGSRPVHRREYTETNRVLSTSRIAFGPQSNPNYYVGRTGVSCNIAELPARTSQAVAIGNELLRASRPTKQQVSLGQFIGELRDFSSLLHGVDPRRNPLAAAGGGYLNLEFGWKPFLGDLLKAAEVISTMQPRLEQFVRDSGRIVRRTRRRIIREDVYTGNIQINGNGTNPTTIMSATFQPSGGGRYVFSWRPMFGLANFKLEPAYPNNVVITVTEEVRSFASFEYFAYDPKGFLGRMKSYGQKADYLLGLDLKPSLIWELTPWSWMVDWFYDFGGFLAFAEDIADYSLVARQAGVVHEVNISVHGAFRPVYTSGTPSYWSWADRPTLNAITDYKYQRRLPSNGYTVGPTTDLNNQQWAILAALGLTRAPGRLYED